jgi:hypothetical protein
VSIIERVGSCCLDTGTDRCACEVARPVPLIPFFEGKQVDATALKIANSSVLDLTDVVLGMDDVIQIVVEAKVTGVNHVVHEPTGRLIRVHTAKAFDARLMPFNPTYDDGVDRRD